MRVRQFKPSRIQIQNATSCFSKVMATIVACFSGVLLFGILIFILVRAIQGFDHYGINAILGSLNFNFSSDNAVSFWPPFTATLITTFIALIIAVPLGVKSATFLKFRVNKHYQKPLRIAIETLAGIPSVVFGLFAAQSLKSVVGLIGISSYSILNASIMLAFMILPTVLAMTYNSLENVDMNLFENPLALGCTKTKAIYKVYKKAAKSGIIVGVILAAGRAIGETMALSMLLQSQNNYDSVFSSGLGSILSSNIKTISVIISTNMFTENSSEALKSLLFAFGFILFVVIMLINLIVLWFTRNKKHVRLPKFLMLIKDKYNWFFDTIHSIVETIFFPFRRNTKINSEQDVLIYMEKRFKHYKFKDAYSWYKLFWEIVCILICFCFLTWLFFDIVVMGIQAWNASSASVFMYTKNTTGQAFWNTFLVILVAILIGFPISLFTAIYLNEFCKNKVIKKIIYFFLDSLGAVPSILFGMFGLIFFIYELGWTSQGGKGFSLLAGALTVTIVIIPSFSRTIQQALSEVPMDLRQNGLALGCTPWKVVYKLVLPAAINGLATSIVLAIGRILSETATLYLTAGLTSSAQIALVNPGQTLTTRIYAQLTNTNVTDGLNIMYESAFLILLIVLFLIAIAYYIIPNWRSIKNEVKFWIFKANQKLQQFKNFKFSNKNY
ncbi:MAG: phosphate ABC transporter permease PstA [Malacoplasma sp.]|nr:phosphate ABC transporter permease PstA [Malacoplasma sp.]